MSTKILDLAEQLGLDVKALKLKITELGFEISPRARVVDDELAALILDDFNDSSEEIEDPTEVADIYGELIGEEQDRAIIKQQRKKTAGRDSSKKSDKVEKVVVDKNKTKSVEIGDVITIKEFAEKTNLTAAKIIGELMKNGILANINQEIDFDTLQVISDDLGVEISRKRSVALAEEFIAGDISNLLKEDDASTLEDRPAVVCIMGHVDHGKTLLLDTIREADVISGESGGITQHIGAYQVKKKKKLITFLDTPGHEAFTSMRARGAKATDIAILVVAADEGIKPQTIEAINHAKEAGVPIIVAINKMDKPGANPDKVKGELVEHGLQPEDWGGKTVCVPVSALKGEGIDELLDMILLTAEMEDLKANPDREAVGTVIEAHLDQGLGPVATVLINTGTLKIMNNIVVGKTYGRIKLMKDYNGKSLRIAVPSTPVLIAGLSAVPKSGDILQVVKNEKIAKTKAAEIMLIENEKKMGSMSSMNKLISQVKSDKVLKIILKADTKGSVEAIKQSLAKIKDKEVAVKIIHSGIGTVTESDIMMGAASNGIVAAFHADFYSPNVKKTAMREGVEVKKYTVIYDLIEDVKRILSGLLEPEIIEIVLGRAVVKQIFLTKKKEMVVGCRVNSGKMKLKANLKVIRGVTKDDEDNIVGTGTIQVLRKVDKEVKEINEGNECGIKFTGDVKLEEGDILEAFEEEEKTRTVQ